MRKRWRCFGTLLGLMLLCGGVWACAICAPADGSNTVRSRLQAADAVVWAVPANGAYRVAAVAKGAAPPGPIGHIDWQGAPPSASSPAPVLLAYSAAGQSWRSLGLLAMDRQPWLRRLLDLPPAAGLAPPDWVLRLAPFVRELEDAEPLVAQAAYEEVSAAPYAVMRALPPLPHPERLRRWLDDPALAARRPLYLLLAGLAGGRDAASDMRARVERGLQGGPPAVLSGALAAYVELQGPAGVELVETEILMRAGSSEAQVQAAVLALAVHGAEGVRVPRARVVEAFGRLAARNPAMAGFAASDLAAWGHWDMGPRYAEILGSGQPLAFAARYAMVFYLLRSPRPDARSALEALRAARVL